VTGDYPHEEVSRPGVNHFPRGVFQICLTGIEEQINEALQREAKKKWAKKSPQKVKRPLNRAVAPIFHEDGDDDEEIWTRSVNQDNSTTMRDLVIETLVDPDDDNFTNIEPNMSPRSISSSSHKSISVSAYSPNTPNNNPNLNNSSSNNLNAANTSTKIRTPKKKKIENRRAVSSIRRARSAQQLFHSQSNLKVIHVSKTP
jgi:hypothetical protein